jgi:hypothetical protein
MLVKATISFVDGKYGRHNEDDVFELPAGCDWLQSGLVEPVEPKIETAAIEPPKRAVKKTNTPRKPKVKKDTK